MPSSANLYTLSLHDALPIFSGVNIARRFRVPLPLLIKSSPNTGLAAPLRVKNCHPVNGATACCLARMSPGIFEVSIHQQLTENRSEEHTSELQSRENLVCRLPPTSTLFPYTTLFRSSPA